MRQQTREKALTERQFERLLIGAMRIEDAEQAMETRAMLLIGGRLGLRPGEVTHLDASWINRRREMLSIPNHDSCTKGRDGSPCGYCRQAANQQLKHDDTKEFDDVIESYWNPKTDAAVRDVPFGWSQRISVAIEWLIDTHGGWPYSFSTLQRRLETALDRADRLEKDDTSLHGLRGTAASYHAGRGLDSGPLQSMFGWSDLATAKNYIAVDGEMTARALREAN
ncbi:tyrosine-type recombinase/integrase [Halorubrum trueperi]|uniref:Tyrosine-type recombinase/integrase n=1 Tax=Halorubrum trueperi TaxID=2004704 RepID=A0ABD5UFI4_9EURY